MVAFTMRTSTAGNPIQRQLHLGSLSNTSGTSTQVVFVTHDSPGDLWNVGFYIQPHAGFTYTGYYGEAQDYQNILEWGDTAGKGLMLNQDIAATSTASDVQITDATGHSRLAAIPLESVAVLGGGSTAQGHFPVGSTCKLIMKLSVPVTETAQAVRNFSLFLNYD